MTTYCAITIDGDLRVGGVQQQRTAIRQIRQAHAALGLTGRVTWFINEHDFKWTTYHPDLLLELVESGEGIGLHDHVDSWYLENAPAAELCSFFEESRQKLASFYLRHGWEPALQMHRNGCCVQGANLYQALENVGYTILSDVRPEMAWWARMVKRDDSMFPWRCLNQRDPTAIFTDNRAIPLRAAPWRHQFYDWLDQTPRPGSFLHVPIACVPWIEQERVQAMVKNTPGHAVIVIDTHPYDLQNQVTGAVCKQNVDRYLETIRWIRLTLDAVFIRMDQIPDLIE